MPKPLPRHQPFFFFFFSHPKNPALSTQYPSSVRSFPRRCPCLLIGCGGCIPFYLKEEVSSSDSSMQLISQFRGGTERRGADQTMRCECLAGRWRVGAWSVALGMSNVSEHHMHALLLILLSLPDVSKAHWGRSAAKGLVLRQVRDTCSQSSPRLSHVSFSESDPSTPSHTFKGSRHRQDADPTRFNLRHSRERCGDHNRWPVSSLPVSLPVAVPQEAPK